MNPQQSMPPISTTQVAPPIAPINPQSIAQSESPTAIILAIAVLISILIGSMTGLVRVMMLAMHQSRSSR